MDEKSMNIQWYPGHMTKTRRIMEEDLKLVDAVCEILDARIPISSRNPDIDTICGSKPRMIILNRIDMADPAMVARWSEYFKRKGWAVIQTDCKSRKGINQFAPAVRTLLAEKLARYAEKGQVGRPLKLMVVGIPNVGKSTLLSVTSNAHPKIANYHFTTLNPHLGVVDLGDGAGFVMADIPGLIEGASEGVGLGHSFLRHIERTKVLVHVVDGASVEGRDPLEDILTINKELEAYNPELLKRPQVIAANKMDACFSEDDSNDIIARLKAEFEPKGIKVFPISAVSRQGVKELLWHVNDLLKTVDSAPVVFQKEFEIEYQGDRNLPYTVTRADDGAYVVEGPRIEKMLGYTNLDSEKGFQFFQKFLKQSGILADLEKAGIQEGDTVRMYGLVFDYYK